MSENDTITGTIRAIANAAGWILAQIQCARGIGDTRQLFRLLDEHTWALGYSVGAFQAAHQITRGIQHDVEEVADVWAAFLLYLKLRPEEVGRLISLDRVEMHQREPVYLAGMAAGGNEIFMYLRKTSDGSLNLPRDMPSKLFTYLAPKRCHHRDGREVPDLDAIIEIPRLALDIIERTIQSAARESTSQQKTAPDNVSPERDTSPARYRAHSPPDDSGRKKAGGGLTALALVTYLVTVLLAFGALFSGCVSLLRGDLVGFVFSLGLAVVIGWVGRFVAALFFVGSAIAKGD